MKRHVREGARSGTAGPENGGETVKKYTLPLVMWAIFETIAIILWLTKNNKKRCIKRSKSLSN